MPGEATESAHSCSISADTSKQSELAGSGLQHLLIGKYFPSVSSVNSTRLVAGGKEISPKVSFLYSSSGVLPPVVLKLLSCIVICGSAFVASSCVKQESTLPSPLES